MDRAQFEKCVAVTLAYEGGNSDDSRDPGGRTSRGITQREWDSYRRAHPELELPQDVFDAPQSAVLDIYWGQYWCPVAGDDWPAGLNLCTFDAGVNSGLGRSLTWARATLGQRAGTFVLLASIAAQKSDQGPLIHDFQKRRLAFLEGLSIWSTFQRGWTRRVAGVEALAVKWALEATGQPKALVALEMDTQTRSAARRARIHAVLAFVAAVVPTWLHYLADQNLPWSTYPMHSALLALTFLVVGTLTWWAHKYHVRSQALRRASLDVDDTALIHYIAGNPDSAAPVSPRPLGATRLNAAAVPALPSQVPAPPSTTQTQASAK